MQKTKEFVQVFDGALIRAHDPETAVEELLGASLYVYPEREMSFLNVLAYCERKIVPLIQAGLTLSSGVSESTPKIVWIIGCEFPDQEMQNSVLQSLGLQDVSYIGAPSEILSRGRKPRLASAKRDGQQVNLILTPPGRDQTRLYAQALRVYCNEKFITIQLRAFCLSNVSDQNTFEKLYNVVGEERVLLASIVNGAVVVVGGGFDQRSGDDKEPTLQRPFQDEPWKEISLSIPVGYCWTARSYALDSNRIVFLSWKPSFWGDLALGLGTMLFKMGVRQLIHAGSKVGSSVSANDSKKAEMWIPKTYQIVAHGHEKILVSSFRRAFYAKSLGIERTALHISVPNPLDESKELMHHLAKYDGFATIDDEGAQFARAAELHGGFYDGIYFVSDYIRRDHEGDVVVDGASITTKVDKSRQLKIFEDIARKLEMHMAGSVDTEGWHGFRSATSMDKALYARDNLLDEVKNLFDDTANVKGIVLSGMAGSGKSSLIAKSCALYGNYFGSVWWLDAANLEWSEKRLAESIFGLHVINEKSRDECFDILKNMVKRADRRILLVIENADTRDLFEKVKNRWWNLTGKSLCLLISTRLRRVQSMQGMQLVVVEPLGEMDAIILLLHVSDQPFNCTKGADRDDCQRKLELLTTEEKGALKSLAVDKLGGLPLGITLLGRAKAMGGCALNSWKKVLDKWKEEVIYDTNDRMGCTDPTMDEAVKETEFAKRVVGTSLRLSMQLLSSNASADLNLASLWSYEGGEVPIHWLSMKDKSAVELD